MQHEPQNQALSKGREGQLGNKRAQRWMLDCVLLAAGLIIAWFDIQPNWDDTGILAMAIAVSAGIGVAVGVPLWRSVLWVSGPLVIMERALGAGILVVVLIALLGASVGRLLKRITQ